MTKEEIIELAKQAGFERLGHDEHDYVCYPDDIVAFAKLVAEHEREACAKVADGWPDYDVQGLAEAIRARENHD
jgi:hypothetical protein